MIIKYIYSVFIGVLLATFIGVGIAAFYPSPKSPDVSYPPMAPPLDVKDATTSALQLKEQRQIDQVYKEYQEKSQEYSRNVSMIALVFAVLILAVSLTVASNLEVINDGLLYGSLLTLIYSIIMGFASRDSVFRFVVVTVSLIIALFLGYLKFIKGSNLGKGKR